MTISKVDAKALVWILVLATACTVPPLNYDGKQCTKDAECGGTLACVNGLCRRVVAREDFTTFPLGVWSNNTRVGPWFQEFGGTGGVQVVEDGMPVLLLNTPLTGTPQAALALRDPLDAGVDFVVQLKATGLVASPSQVRLYWDYQGSSTANALVLTQNYWEVRQEGLGGGSKVVYFTSAAPLVNAGAWHQVGVRQLGNEATIYLDGAAAGSVTLDGGRGGGQFGLYVQQAQAEFAEFVIAE